MANVFRAAYMAIMHLARDDGWAMASHLALSALMAIFPFLIFVAALAAFIGHASLADQVTDIIFQAWPQDIAAPIAAEIHDVLTVPRGGILTISILATIYFASNGVEAVRIGLNRAYRAREDRSIFFLRTQSIFFVVIGALLSLAVAVFGLLGPLLWGIAERALPALEPFRYSFFPGRYILLGIMLTAGLMAAHLWLPRGQPRPIWPGIVATLALWYVATAAFAAYLDNFANYSATYAGLASVVAAIFYLYIMGLILLFGAEFNAALAKLSESVAVPEPEVTPVEVTQAARAPRDRRRAPPSA